MEKLETESFNKKFTIGDHHSHPQQQQQQQPKQMVFPMLSLGGVSSGTTNTSSAPIRRSVSLIQQNDKINNKLSSSTKNFTITPSNTANSKHRLEDSHEDSGIDTYFDLNGSPIKNPSSSEENNVNLSNSFEAKTRSSNNTPRLLPKVGVNGISHSAKAIAANNRPMTPTKMAMSSAAPIVLNTTHFIPTTTTTNNSTDSASRQSSAGSGGGGVKQPPSKNRLLPTMSKSNLFNNQEDLLLTKSIAKDLIISKSSNTNNNNSTVLNKRENNALNKEEKDTMLKQLDLLSTIGTGTFGRVMIAQNKASKDYYALKIMSIHDIVRLNQIVHVNNEKSVLESIDAHPFIVKLFWTHHTSQYLYMLLEYVPGGELFSLLRKHERFETKTAVFYAAEIVCALEFLHSMQIVYRDLKPENILLDLDGHLKLTDFGFAKRVTDKTYTLCGTPEYLAPELISNRGHDMCCDWWTLGVIIYEFLSGSPPFYDQNQCRVYEKILSGKIEWPRYFDTSAKDIIKKLLVTDPTKRLGSGNCGLLNNSVISTNGVFITETESLFGADNIENMIGLDFGLNSSMNSTSTNLNSSNGLNASISKTQKQKIRSGCEEIKRHRWFISIANWNDVYEKKLKPPFKPDEINYGGDTRNFEKYDTPDLSKAPVATKTQLDYFVNF